MDNTAVSTNVLSRMQERESALSQVPERYLQLIKRTIAPDATNEELEMFIYTAVNYNLDPIMKEIVFLKIKGRVSFVVARDGYAKIAKQDPGYDGYESFVVREGDVFEMDVDEYKIKHKITGKRGKIIGAWGRAFHKNRRPVVCFVEFSEYRKRNNNAWDNYPSAMIQKVAESFVLRRQFDITGTAGAAELGLEDEEGNWVSPGEDFIDIQGKPTDEPKLLSKVEAKELKEQESVKEQLEKEEDSIEVEAVQIASEMVKKTKKPKKESETTSTYQKDDNPPEPLDLEKAKEEQEKKVKEQKEVKETKEESSKEPDTKKLQEINLDEMDLTNITNLNIILTASDLEENNPDNLLDLAKKLLKRNKIDVPEFVKIKEQIKAL